MSLYDHALRLRRLDPGAVLPAEDEPYPDEDKHRLYPRAGDQRRWGMEAAAILDAHFARPGAQPADLAWAFHHVPVPIHRSDHIAAAALRVDQDKVRETGRWLVRHSPDRCSALVGMALLATDWAEEDTELIKVIGLLSDRFCPLAADALKRRRNGTEALIWLAERVTGWGRVYVVEALCRTGSTSARPWLLRHACDGDYLNRYFAGQVATAAHLHEAITARDPDDELIDHTGRLLTIMASSSGMGLTWRGYPPIGPVLDAHVGHVARQVPSLPRFIDAAQIADFLDQGAPVTLGLTDDQRNDLLTRYRAILGRAEWSAAARAAFDPANGLHAWVAKTIMPRLRLPGFAGP